MVGASASSWPPPLTHTLAPQGVWRETLGAAAAVAPQLVLTAMLAAMRPVTFIHVCMTEKERGLTWQPSGPPPKPRLRAKPGSTFAATARAVRGEALIALAAEATWVVAAVSTGATQARLGQALVVICRGWRTGRATLRLGIQGRHHDSGPTSTVWLWASHLPSFCLSFPLCEMRFITVPTSLNCCEYLRSHT